MNKFEKGTKVKILDRTNGRYLYGEVTGRYEDRALVLLENSKTGFSYQFKDEYLELNNEHN